MGNQKKKYHDFRSSLVEIRSISFPKFSKSDNLRGTNKLSFIFWAVPYILISFSCVEKSHEMKVDASMSMNEIILIRLQFKCTTTLVYSFVSAEVVLVSFKITKRTMRPDMSYIRCCSTFLVLYVHHYSMLSQVRTILVKVISIDSYTFYYL